MTTNSTGRRLTNSRRRDYVFVIFRKAQLNAPWPERFGSSRRADGEKAVVYRSRMNPSLGRNFEAMDPLEWLARLSDHIPDPGQHRTLFYGEYSNRVRGSGLSSEPEVQAGEEQPPRKRRSPSWGRLIAKVYQVDPLLGTRCGKRMSLIAFVTDQVAVGRILDHRPKRPLRRAEGRSRASSCCARR